MDNTKIIAIFNQKGGVGKTTTVLSLASWLGKQGKKVLAVDFDPQASLTICTGLKHPDELEHTIFELLAHRVQYKENVSNISEYIVNCTNFDLIPSNINLSTAELQIVSLTGREYLLKRILSDLRGDYDYILIDCPPTLGMLSVNALTAADSVLIPLQAHYLSAKGFELLTDTIAMIKEETNPTLTIEGILLTMADGRTNYTEQIQNSLREALSDSVRIFDTPIPSSIGVTKSQEKSLTVFDHVQCASVAAAYEATAKELIKCN